MVAIHSNYIRDRETCKLSSSTPFEVDHNLILHVNGSSVCECRVKPLIDRARINSFRRWEILSCFNKLSGEFDDGTGGGGGRTCKASGITCRRSTNTFRCIIP